MTSYAQWRHSADKGQVARVTWLCGDQRVLVEEVIDETKRSLNISELDYCPISGVGPAADIWDAAYQYPLDPSSNRLVLVREADYITNWKPLKNWFKDSRQLVSNYIVFVSDEPDYPVVPDSSDLQDHIELIRAKGKIVRCSMPSSGDVQSWIERNSTFQKATAKFLMDRASGDLSVIANVCKKSLMFKKDPGVSVVSQLTEEAPSESFVDALLNMDKKTALVILDKLSEDDYARTIGQLYSRLDLMRTLYKAVPNFSTVRELSAATGVKIFLAQKYSKLAKSYDSVKINKCRNLLTVVDDAIQRRAYSGAMELLVDLW